MHPNEPLFWLVIITAIIAVSFVVIAVAMIAMVAGRAMIVGIGKRGLTFKHVYGVVEHHRHDAGKLGDQK